jgi:hypothetical protein
MEKKFYHGDTENTEKYRIVIATDERPMNTDEYKELTFPSVSI